MGELYQLAEVECKGVHSWHNKSEDKNTAADTLFKEMAARVEVLGVAYRLAPSFISPQRITPNCVRKRRYLPNLSWSAASPSHPNGEHLL